MEGGHVNDYKCHWRGGCSKVGIPPESIEKARIVLEHYAWKNLRVGRRRLLEDGDSMNDFSVPTVRIPWDSMKRVAKSDSWDQPSHTQPHMPDSRRIGDWINFRL